MNDPRKPPRLPSVLGDRDVRKPITPPKGVAKQLAAPHEVPREITGVYEGEALAKMRAKRPTDERVGRLEQKHDELAGVVTETRVIVGEMRGELRVLPEVVEMVRDIQKQHAAREHVTFTAKVDVEKAHEIARVEDHVDARKTKRALWLKVVTGVIALISSGAFLHWLAGKF